MWCLLLMCEDLLYFILLPCNAISECLAVFDMSGGGGLDSGAIVGVVFAVLFVVIVLGFVGMVMYRRRNALPTNLTGSFDNPSYSSSSGIVNVDR